MLNIESIQERVKALVASDPSDPSIPEMVDALEQTVMKVQTSAAPINLDVIQEQIDRLHAAAVVPARNYSRIASILSSLSHILKVARRPGNESVHEKVASVSSKISGIFSQVDVRQDLDESLKSIEASLKELYNGRTSSVQPKAR